MAGVPMKLHRDYYGGPLGIKISLLIFFPEGHFICNFEAIIILMDINLILFDNFMFSELGILKIGSKE
ncbi:MAG: hypothetical protein H8D45_23950 [Bacteroidetes bacterium]|nr:hypothetical protein [Bacteroidota bacterium]